MGIEFVGMGIKFVGVGKELDKGGVEPQQLHPLPSSPLIYFITIPSFKTSYSVSVIMMMIIEGNICSILGARIVYIHCSLMMRC